MRFNSIALAAVCAALAFSACSSGKGSGGSSGSGGCSAAISSCTSATGSVPIPTPNPASSTLQVDIGDPSTTGSWTYKNEPLVSVTICSPNHGIATNECQTVSNILLDTGSYGLRVFGSAITNSQVQPSPIPITYNGQQMDLAECAEFGTGASWGSIQTADVILGNQTAVAIPIQIIDYNYASLPAGCAALCPDTDPCSTGFNGILGVGIFAQDCGSSSDPSAECASTEEADNPGIYFACNGSGCYNATCGSSNCALAISLGDQVINPISSLTLNGVSLTIPSTGSVGSSGNSGVTGTVTLGIGAISSVNVYAADSSGMTDGNGADLTTIFGSTTYGGHLHGSGSSKPTLSFIDSGSNGLFFASSVATCSDNPDFYCPGSTTGESTTMEGYAGTFSGSNSNTVTFNIANSDSLFNTGNSAFNNLCGTMSGGIFDWGLPFFYNRTVYIGLTGATATINGSSVSGPYWAF